MRFLTALAFASLTLASQAVAHSGHIAPQDGHSHGWPIVGVAALVVAGVVLARVWGSRRR